MQARIIIALIARRAPRKHRAAGLERAAPCSCNFHPKISLREDSLSLRQHRNRGRSPPRWRHSRGCVQYYLSKLSILSAERERCFASSRKTAGTRGMQRRIRITIQILITGFPSGVSRHAPRDVQFAIKPKLASLLPPPLPRRGEALCAEPAKKAIPQNRDSVRPVFPRSGTHAKTVRYVRSIKPIWSESLESSISIRSPIRDCYERDGNTRQLLASTLAFGIRERANRLLIKMEITR